MLRASLVKVIRFYQVGISPWTPPACRFSPTCSAYAIEALEVYGVARGSWLTVRRLLRCHPWGGKGFDPVPRAGGAGMEADGTVAREGEAAESRNAANGEAHQGDG